MGNYQVEFVIHERVQEKPAVWGQRVYNQHYVEANDVREALQKAVKKQTNLLNELAGDEEVKAPLYVKESKK